MYESDSLVIIPTYNEKENMENILRAVFSLDKCFHVLVIDDGSPDGTADIVKRLMQDEFAERLFLIEQTGFGNSLYSRLQVGFGKQIRLCFRNGRRL